ncbi:DUF5805 domain-containing protein [Halorubrum vacuolatum]|uniref:Uncharacterized protein n=1 Tax=Halorubrum vacuolatum TaxID=63740 RepID=A0A238VEN5_HALVU|nr:DUF5805 domain-containing protein [Halorubrum vacuolatum]SNR32628.1 hypothetical protein SAMN06264855_102335 [Halorubrum vacuolatum]
MSSERRTVKTYVPAAQKHEWERHAEELGMSQSEFVKTMVQAGRRGFTLQDPNNPPKASSDGSNPRGNVLEERIERALAEGPRSWDDLIDEVRGDLEDRLDSALDALQDRNRVRYSGRDGGYVLIDE